MTELAVVFPTVLLFLVGIFDFAQAFYAYGTVSEAARAGARYAMVHGSMAASPVGPTANNANVANVVRSYAPALDTSKLTITSNWKASSNDAGCPVTVTTTFNCQPIVGRFVGFGAFNVTGTTTMIITR